EDLDVNDGAFDARRARQRSIADIAGLFTEDGAQQLLFRSELRFALRRDLADHDVARFDGRADADDSALVEIAQRAFAHVRDVARDFFRTQLRIARFDLEFFDVDGGVVILLHHLFRDQDRVFEVVAAPWHESDQDVSSERQLAVVRARTVGDDLTLHNAVALLHDRTLVDTGVLVGALELRQLINIAADFTRQLHRVMLAFHAHDDALGIDRIDDAGTASQNDGSRIAGSHAFHTGADDRRLRTEKRHGLTLHVRAHECAVSVIVLEERYQRGSDRYELLRANVDVVDLIAVDENEVTRLTRIDQLTDEFSLLIELGVSLRDRPLVFFPSRQIE